MENRPNRLDPNELLTLVLLASCFILPMIMLSVGLTLPRP